LSFCKQNKTENISLLEKYITQRRGRINSSKLRSESARERTSQEAKEPGANQPRVKTAIGRKSHNLIALLFYTRLRVSRVQSSRISK